MNSLPDSALHRNVDLEVLGVSEEVNAHIILPSTIWGHADHALVKKGIANHQSIQVCNFWAKVAGVGAARSFWC